MLGEDRPCRVDIAFEHHDPMPDHQGVLGCPPAAVAVNGRRFDPAGFQRGDERVGLESRRHRGQLDDSLAIAMVSLVTVCVMMERHAGTLPV